MDEYISLKEAAQEWGISTKQVRIYCQENRIIGAVRLSNTWAIPSETKKPLVNNIEKDTSKSKSKRKLKLNVLSLFSGCGGMDLGFEGDFEILRASLNTNIHNDWIFTEKNTRWVKLKKTYFNTVFANDIRPDAKAVWTKYFGKKGIKPEIYYLDSIVDLVKRQKNSHINILPEKIDIVTGGFPCQDFSVAGKRMGFKSDKGHDGIKFGEEYHFPDTENRGQLYIWMKEVIAITKPKLFIAENVKGLINLDDVKEVIQRDFEEVCNNGYLVIKPRILNAANYGVPQSRERVFFLGFLKSALCPEALKALENDNIPDEYDPYPPKTHYIDYNLFNTKLLPAVTVGQALEDLPEPEDSNDISHRKYSRAKYMGKHCQGQTEVNWNGIGPTIRSEHHGNIEYRRLSIEHGGKNTEELNNGFLERRLSVRECARIQTFPDDFEFVFSNTSNNEKGVSASEAYKLIGNAVPPLLAYHLAKRLEKNWFKYFKEEIK